MKTFLFALLASTVLAQQKYSPEPGEMKYHNKFSKDAKSRFNVNGGIGIGGRFFLQIFLCFTLTIYPFPPFFF